MNLNANLHCRCCTLCHKKINMVDFDRHVTLTLLSYNYCTPHLSHLCGK